MAIPSLFRQRKPKEFHFTARHYDPAKEAREERERRIKHEMGMEDSNNPVSAGSQGLSGNSQFRFKRERSQKSSGIRLVIILLILFLLAYVFWVI